MKCFCSVWRLLTLHVFVLYYSVLLYISRHCVYVSYCLVWILFVTYWGTYSITCFYCIISYYFTYQGLSCIIDACLYFCRVFLWKVLASLFRCSFLLKACGGGMSIFLMWFLYSNIRCISLIFVFMKTWFYLWNLPCYCWYFVWRFYWRGFLFDEKCYYFCGRYRAIISIAILFFVGLKGKIPSRQKNFETIWKTNGGSYFYDKKCT